MIQFKYKTSSLTIANVIKRTFETKFSAGVDSLPLTPDHEKTSKRKVLLGSWRLWMIACGIILCSAFFYLALDTSSISLVDLKNFTSTLTRIIKSTSKKGYPKLRGEDIIPQNAEGFAVYVAIYFVIWLSIEYLLYRLEQQDAGDDESNAAEDL